MLKLQWHAKVYEETFHVSGNLRSGVLLPFLLGDMGKRMPDRFTLHIVCAPLVQNLDFCLIGRKTKDPFLQSSAPIGQATYVTLFGKTRLNENSVEPFFHFNAFWKRSNALQIIFNAF